jgi:membrane protease YdiL (CAAX protease family)
MKRTVYCCQWIEVVTMVCFVVGFVVFFAKTGRSLGTEMVFVGSAHLAMMWRKEPLTSVGLCWNARWQDMLALIAACGVSGLVLFLGSVVLKRVGMGWLLPVAVPSGSKLAWILRQFVQVAFCEELFFRGYVQGRVRSLLQPICVERDHALATATIVISSGVFAIAHCVVWGQWAGIMIFFPGLVLGWLFWRTNSLLEPVLYHGLANIAYVMLLSKG